MPGIRQAPTDHSTEALFVMGYARLKAMAARQLASRRHATMDATELMHELYLRMGQRQALQFEHPAQFFSYAARAMHCASCSRRHLPCLTMRGRAGWPSAARIRCGAPRSSACWPPTAATASC